MCHCHTGESKKKTFNSYFVLDRFNPRQVYLERVLSYGELDLCPSNWKRIVLGKLINFLLGQVTNWKRITVSSIREEFRIKFFTVGRNRFC